MSNQVGTVLQKNGRGSLIPIPPLCVECNCEILAEVSVLDIRRESNQEGRVGRAFPRVWIDAKRLAFNPLNVTTTSVFLV